MISRQRASVRLIAEVVGDGLVGEIVGRAEEPPFLEELVREGLPGLLASRESAGPTGQVLTMQDGHPTLDA